MNNILEYGNLIKRIRDGENLPEIAHYALDCLYKDGPIDTVVLEILSYMKTSGNLHHFFWHSYT